MTTVLMYADTLRSPELRHEVAAPIGWEPDYPLVLLRRRDARAAP